jgi:outer membrane protein TolC
MAVNRRGIRQAENSLKVQDYVFKQQVMTTVASIISLYWDLVSFTEQVKVTEQALATSQKLYEDNKKQVEIGTLAQIAIIQAEAEVATRQQDLTVAQTNVLQQETIIKNALSRNGVASPSVADAHIVPLDKIRVPDVEPIEPIQDLIARAYEERPELPQSRFNIENSKLSILGDRSGLLPSVSAFTTLTNNGQAGPISGLPPLAGNFRAPDPFFVGGYGNLLGQIFSRNFPDYRFGVQLNIPIRNRAAEADYVRDSLGLRQSELQLQKQMNQIRVDVQNSVISLQQARVRYQAALKSRMLEEQTLDAEQKKYALGASTIYNVIQIQRDLATTQGNEVTAESNYIKARNSLDFVTGQILQVNKIDVDEAYKGQVSRPPTPIPVLDQNGQGGRNTGNPQR